MQTQYNMICTGKIQVFSLPETINPNSFALSFQVVKELTYSTSHVLLSFDYLLYLPLLYFLLSIYIGNLSIVR